MSGLLWAWLAGCGAGPADRSAAPPGPVPARIERFEELAEDAGYLVQPGDFRFLDPSACCEPEILCLGNNPTTPYGFLAPPPGPGQTGEDLDPMGNGSAPTFHLREDEALVLLGHTPPPVKYFSFRSYLAIEQAEPEPIPTLGSLGPSLNHLVVAAEAGEEGPFDRPLAVITSSDGAIEDQLRALLQDAGFDPTEVFADRIPHHIPRFGLGPEADQFMGINRFAVFEDPDQAAAFYADPGLTLLRLSPQRPIPITRPHPDPPLPARGSGANEDPWEEALDALKEAIHASYPDHASIDLAGSSVWFETLDCIQSGACAADIRDRYYALTLPFRLEDEEEFAVVYGVNHERTGRASYSNFSVDAVDQMLGLVAVHSGQMAGSARVWLPDHPLADDLYAWVIARDCARRPEPNCVTIPWDCPGVPADRPMVVSFRAYLDPATGAAPLPAELLPDRVARFSPRATTGGTPP